MMWSDFSEDVNENHRESWSAVESAPERPTLDGSSLVGLRQCPKVGARTGSSSKRRAKMRFAWTRIAPGPRLQYLSETAKLRKVFHTATLEWNEGP